MKKLRNRAMPMPRSTSDPAGGVGRLPEQGDADAQYYCGMHGRQKKRKGSIAMLKTSQLEIFEAIVDCGSINKAAEYLNTSQPYLSRVLKELEEEIGKTLLVRGKQGAYPTRDGKFIYDYAKTILLNLKKIEEFKNLDLDQMERSLSVSSYSFFLDKSFFLGFASDNLANAIYLSAKEGNLVELFENVLGGVSDLGIAVINDVEFPAVQSAAIAQNLHYEILDTCPLYVHVGQKHQAYDKEEIYMQDLLYSTYMHIPFDRFSKARMEIEIDGIRMKEFKQTMVADHYNLMIFLMQNLDCFMFGNKWQQQTLARAGIKSKIMMNTEIRMHLVVFYKGKTLSEEAKKVRDLFCAQYLGGSGL